MKLFTIMIYLTTSLSALAETRSIASMTDVYVNELQSDLETTKRCLKVKLKTSPHDIA